MSDLIDRKDAIDAIRSLHIESEEYHEYNHGLYAAIIILDGVLPAEKAGKWIILGDPIENQVFDECKCSECGCVEYFNKGYKRFNYCPNCGARMQE